jgi:hypothetical protein
MILIGSRAFFLRCPDALSRYPKDFDWVCTQQEYEHWMKINSAQVKPTKVYPENGKMIVEGLTNCEFEIIQPDTSCQMLKGLVEDNEESIKTSLGWVPTLDLLFTIKSSHRYRKFEYSDHVFWKTFRDYHVMKRLGAKVRPEYRDFLAQREKETYTYQHPKLNQDKEGFFKSDGLTYIWDHDTVHLSVAQQEKPAYTYYMKDGAQVQCDKEKFFACTREIQLSGVVEEAAVLAIERSLVPHAGVWTPERAWKFALGKVMSSITSGWFREFAFENGPEILKLYPKGYWEKFQADTKSGLVKPFVETQ